MTSHPPADGPRPPAPSGPADPGERGGPGGRAARPAELAGRLRADLAAACDPTAPAHSWCAGAVVLAGHRDRVLAHEAAGWALRYAGYDEAAGRAVELPRERWIPARRETVFDLASLTKLFTTVVVLQQVERGKLELDARVARHLPEFGGAGKQDVTLRHLLTHTSGLPAELPFHDCPDAAARLAMLAGAGLSAPPGAEFRYSDPNIIALGLVVERVAGAPLDVLVRDGITEPLGMTRTRFAPPDGWREGIAATEDQRRPWGRLERGMVHGVVHDENAYAFGGVAGHAGLFSDAAGLGALCRALLSDGGGILRPASVRLLLADAGPPGPPHGLGFALDRPEFMGTLAGPRTAGHTGFTGTALVLDPVSGGWLVLLATAVHPVRGRPAPRPHPRAVLASHLAEWLREDAGRTV